PRVSERWWSSSTSEEKVLTSPLFALVLARVEASIRFASRALIAPRISASSNTRGAGADLGIGVIPGSAWPRTTAPSNAVNIVHLAVNEEGNTSQGPVVESGGAAVVSGGGIAPESGRVESGRAAAESGAGGGAPRHAPPLGSQILPVTSRNAPRHSPLPSDSLSTPKCPWIRRALLGRAPRNPRISPPPVPTRMETIPLTESTTPAPVEGWKR